MTYKSFSSFEILEPVFGNFDDRNHGVLAKAATPPCQSEYFENDYFLLHRSSEYAAQIELACAEIFKMMLGYGPEMEILQRGEHYYIASRRIRNFKDGYPDFTDSAQWENISGLAATRVLYYFLCGTDNHSGNFGVSSLGDKQMAYRIDMPEALDLDFLKRPLGLNGLQRLPYIAEEDFEGDSSLFLPVDYVTSSQFQNEKQQMIAKIAATPFAEFEAILRAVISSDAYAHATALARQSLPGSSPEVVAEIDNYLANLDPKALSLEAMIDLLRARQLAWQQLLLLQPCILQDLTLSDHDVLSAAINALHKEADSSSDSDPAEDERLSRYGCLGMFAPKAGNHAFDAGSQREFRP